MLELVLTALAVRASAGLAGRVGDDGDVVAHTARAAYEQAGVAVSSAIIRLVRHME